MEGRITWRTNWLNDRVYQLLANGVLKLFGRGSEFSILLK